MMRELRIRKLISIVLPALILAAACAPSSSNPQLQPTVDSLTARNAMQAAVSPAAQPTPAPPNGPIQPKAAVPGPAAAASAYDSVTRLTLTAGDVHLADFRLDDAAQIAYLTDSAYVLHIVDLARATEVASIPVSGDRLVLDQPDQRLYVMPDVPYARADISPTVTVFDTAARAVIGEIPGSRMGLDSTRNRLYIGDAVRYYGDTTPGVRLYEAKSLKLVRTGPMAGNPLYNPDSDELIIQGLSAWTADPNTLAPRADLYPEITGIDLPGCTGCPAAVDAFYFPAQHAVAIQKTIIAPQGAGRVQPPDIYDAKTMARLPDLYQMDATCSSQPVLRPPLTAKVLRNEHYARYVAYNNLYWTDRSGRVELARDGLWLSFFDEAAGVGIMRSSSTTGYVIGLDSLAPTRMIGAYCIFAADDRGRLYATDNARGDLILFAGGHIPPATPAAQKDTVEGKQITAIVPSPNMAKDGTFYVAAWTLDAAGGQVILRTTDGGQTFTRLGGLPVGDELALTVAVSPDFAHDNTLFVGGLRREFMGEGVWKSTDRGDTWQPSWNGLTYLRVNRIEVSPRYAEDQTVLAWGPYTDILAGATGYAIQRSTDGGLQWTRVMTAASLELLPQPSAYLPTGAALPVRKTSWNAPIEVRIDNTNWTSATADLGAGEIPRAVFTAPAGAPAAVYVATEKGVYRTLDSGRTWARLGAPAGHGALMAAAATPRLSDGAYRLLLATAEGGLAQIDPATVPWEEVAGAEQALSGTATGIVTATAVATTTDTAAAATAAATGAPSAEEQPPAGPAAAAGPEAGPPPGFFRPAGIFGPAWEADGALQQALGYARSVQPNSVPAAYQYFEHGAMVWRGDTRQVYAIYADNTWGLFADTFAEGDAESDPSLTPPSGLMQPVRGFGKVWRTHEQVRAQLGWATGKEAGINALVQEFERGVYLRADTIEAALIEGAAGRTWRR